LFSGKHDDCHPSEDPPGCDEGGKTGEGCYPKINQKPGISFCMASRLIIEPVGDSRCRGGDREDRWFDRHVN
jgi:hypothetical protein